MEFEKYLNSEDFKNNKEFALNLYSEYLQSFLQYTKDCLPILTQTGSLLNKKWCDQQIPLWAIYCHDLIKRIRENLFFYQ